MCFILSLGNRPQGSKWGYTGAMIGFAIITVYMTVCLPRNFYHRNIADARHRGSADGSIPTRV